MTFVKSNEDINKKTERGVVCLLDILGFKYLPSKTHAVDIFETLSAMFKAFTEQKDSVGISDLIFQRIEFQYFGDSIYILLDLEEFKEQLRIIEDFLRFISTFSVLFIMQTGYFMRGGIGFGSYIQRKILNDRTLFIYGKSLNEASNLEQQADVPRIIISKDLYSYIQKLSKKDLKQLPIFECCDGEMILDIYSSFVGLGRGFNVREEIKLMISAINNQCR